MSSTAGTMKLFSSNADGFVPALKRVQAQIALEGSSSALAQKIFNLQIDIAVTSLFLVAVATIVAASVVEWVRMARGMTPIRLRESEFVALPESV